MAHFEEPQIFVAQFIDAANLFRVLWPTLKGSHTFVAHFDYFGDVMTTKLLGSASELTGGIGAYLQRKIRSMRLQFMGAGPYGCSNAPVILNLIRLANPLLKYANICGPPYLPAVARQLRTSGVKVKAFTFTADKLRINSIDELRYIKGSTIGTSRSSAWRCAIIQE